MKASNLRFCICLLAFSAVHNVSAEVSFRAVAVTGDAAVGFGGNAKYSQFSCLSLACDGRVAFSGQALGTGITPANSGGVWAGLPGSLNLIARTGNQAPGMPTGVTFQFFNGVNIDCYQHLAFSSSIQGPGISPGANGGLWIAGVEVGQIPNPAALIIPDSNHLAGVAIVGKTVSSGCNAEALIHNTNVFACGVDLLGAGIVPGDNDNAIIEGAYDNWSVAVRTGTPAPGTGQNFSGLFTDQKALAPDGKVAFKSTQGLWLGGVGGLQAIGLTGGAAPVAIAGGGCTYLFLSNLIDINGQDQVAFTAYLNGPNLNNSNNQFVVAGAPGALHAVAQSGQPAPGVPGGLFQAFNSGTEVFSQAMIGSDGSVAFVAACGTNGYDYGLWFAPAGGSLRLVARSGTQPPGTAPGVMFTNSFQFLSPFQEIYLNGQNQIVFLAQIGGTGVGQTNNTGIWFVDSDGNVSLLVRSGDVISASGVSRALATVTFGSVGVPTVAGSEDGRPIPFNDNGDVFFNAFIQPSGQGLFIAHNGIVLSPSKSGTNFLIQFPTISGKHYRVDYVTNLPPPGTWPVLSPSILGTGGQVTVIDTNGAVFDRRYYRVVRTD